MNKEETAFNAIGCVMIIPWIIASYALRAWAIVTLWTWFIFPTWHVAIPSSEAAIGLSILSGIFTHHAPDKKPDDNDYPLWSRQLFSLAVPLIAVLSGSVVRWWFRGSL